MASEIKSSSMATTLDFDVHLNWSVTDACSLRCAYCHPRVRSADQTADSNDRADLKPVPLPGPINIEKFIRSLDGTGKIFKVFFGGGEPFLIPNFVDVIEAVTVRHRVEVVTNLVTGDVQGLIRRVSSERRLCIRASLHIQELERRGLTQKFIDHFLAFKKAGIEIFASELGYPPLGPNVVELRKFFEEKGVPFTFKPFRGWFSGQLYPEAYTDEELKAFKLKPSIRPLVQTLGKECNAGVNLAVVTHDGNIYPCYGIKEVIGNVYEGIPLSKTMTKCPVERCRCPLFYYESALYQKAVEDVSKRNVEGLEG